MENKKYDTTCKYGKGTQNMAECKWLYLHIIGYYPAEGGHFETALKNLCPNFPGKKN